MESRGPGGAPLMAQTLDISITAENQESSVMITVPNIELLNLYRLLTKKDTIIEEKERIIESKDAEIKQKDLEISKLMNEIQMLRAQHNNVPVGTGFNCEKIISLLSIKDAEKCADILIDEILPYKDKGKPKMGLFPLFCAIKNGWLERPAYKDFNEAFPGVCENDASYSKYIPDGRKSEYETKPRRSFDFEAHCENMQLKVVH